MGLATRGHTKARQPQYDHVQDLVLRFSLHKPRHIICRLLSAGELMDKWAADAA